VTHTSFIGIFGKKYEEERLEVSMIESFRSSLSMEVRRAQQKLIKRAETKPLETVTLLLRHYDHEDNRVRQAVKQTLTTLSKDKVGMESILTDMVHPSRNVRKAVQGFLGDTVGAHAITYASFYEQTMLLVAMSKRKDIPVDDIMSLADLSKQTFMDGEIMEAVKDIGFSLDNVKHRYRSSEQLKEYVADLLKMAPDLSRMGVYSGAIEEPLRKAMKASRYRNFDETRELIEERTKESKMRTVLHQIAREIKENVNKRPQVKRGELTASDVQTLSQLHDLVDSVTSLVIANERSEASALLLGFEEKFIRDYEHTVGPRVQHRDPAAMFVLYNVGLVCVKLTSSIMAATAEDVYQTGFRHLEGDPSIHIVMWPEAVMGQVLEAVGQESDKNQAST
jgi:Anticodon-binding domain of tRNA ligase